MEDKVVVDVSEDVLEFIKPNMFEKKKMLRVEARKESVTEDYTRERRLSGQPLLWWTKAVTATCDINNAGLRVNSMRKKL
jgi:hypothetical protein